MSITSEVMKVIFMDYEWKRQQFGSTALVTPRGLKNESDQSWYCAKHKVLFLNWVGTWIVLDVLQQKS